MALMIDECFEYRHKKFDQGKKSRTESSSSNSDDYECIQVEIERLNDRPKMQQTPETSSASGLSHNEESNTSAAPPFKRMRTSSYSDSSFSTAYSPMSLPFSTLHIASTLYNTTTATIAPTAAILPKISDETLRNICKYHGNMVRQFPKRDRNPKDQERRNKNTIACRMSRRVKKLEHVAIEEQYKEFSQQTFKIIEQAMRSTLYLHELMRLSHEVGAIGESNLKMEILKEEKPTTSGQDKKSFTIAYLMGNQE